MCAFKLTRSQYTYQHVVEPDRDQIQFYNESHLTHLSRAVLYYAIILGIASKVHLYITSRLLPFEERSEKRPWTDEAKWWAVTRGSR